MNNRRRVCTDSSTIKIQLFTEQKLALQAIYIGFRDKDTQFFMAVIEYKKGEHPQGLIGFRVARTLGSNDQRKEFFFSKSVYGDDASRLAHEKDSDLEKIAIQNRAKNALKQRSPHQFATGFCAKILIEKKVRGGELRTYYSPAFSVTYKGTEKAFRIPKWGFNTAWSKAVSHYAESRQLDGNESLSLLARKPEMSIFTGVLIKRVRAHGHQITKKQLMNLLATERA